MPETKFTRPFPALTPAQRYHLEVYGYVVIENTLTALTPTPKRRGSNYSARSTGSCIPLFATTLLGLGLRHRYRVHRYRIRGLGLGSFRVRVRTRLPRLPLSYPRVRVRVL